MEHIIDIRDVGAVGDGRTVNTRAIQQAIDDCCMAGGGVVLVSCGDFVSGTIYLKDGVTLHVESGAVLSGSTDIDDYATDTHKNMYRGEPHMDPCLIFARSAKGIGITGSGTIDGRGDTGNFPNKEDPDHRRPMLIRFLDCTGIRMRDITLVRPAAWTSAWLYCSDIAVDGVRIHSRANGNGDGLDFDGCRDVRVSNCSFHTSDDSICLQASRNDRPCRDVVITNCVFTSKWAGIRIGLLSRGDIRNVAVNNCVFRDIDDSGLKIQLCEGGEIENLLFSNLVMENVPRPVFVTFCQQRCCVDAPEELAPMKSLSNLMFSDLLVDSSSCGPDSAFIMVGMPGHPIRNVTLNNINFTAGGGGGVEHAGKVLPDLTQDKMGGHWPEYACFESTVPGSGIYAAHIEGLAIRNSTLRCANADARPAVLCHDVSDCEILGLTAAADGDGTCVVRLVDSQRVRVNGAHCSGSVRQLLSVEGEKSSGVECDGRSV